MVWPIHQQSKQTVHHCRGLVGIEWLGFWDGSACGIYYTTAYNTIVSLCIFIYAIFQLTYIMMSMM